MALLGGAATAADLPTRKAPPVVAPALPTAINWTGFYVGVNGGYAGDQFKYPASASYDDGVYAASGGASATLTSSGFLGGVQAGYNWQFAGAWLGGVEADIDATSIAGKIGISGGGSIEGLGSATAGADVKSETPYLGTARARIGYLVNDRFLVFATGGFAYAQVKTSLNASYSDSGGDSGAFSWSKDTTHTGWTLGGGAEYKIDKNWSFKTEYLYVDLGEQTLLSGTAFGGDLAYNLKVHPTDNIVRAGLNFTFN